MRRSRTALLVVSMLVATACGSNADDDAVTSSSAAIAPSSTVSSTTTLPPTTQAAVTSTTAATTDVVSADAGSAANPVALSSYAPAGDWLVRVADVDPGGQRLLVDDDGFLGDPEPGNVFVAMDVEAVYVGDSSESIWFAFFYNARSASGSTYDEFENGCGFFDGALSDTGEAFPGGAVRGLVCFEVDDDDADELALILEPLASFDDSETVFFGLQDGVGSPTGITPAGDVLPVDDPTVGSRTNPIALGSLARVGSWFLEVTSVDPDATDAILAASDFNEPPASGESFLMIEMQATYTGSGSASFFSGLSWSWLGESNVARSSFDHPCGVLDGDLGMSGDLFTNAQVGGAICVAVPEAEATDGLLVIDALGEDRKFLALMPGVGTTGADQIVEGSGTPGSDPGERGNPRSYGETARVATWDVRVGAVNTDAAAALEEESPFNSTPADGMVYLLIEVSLTNTDDDPVGVWETLGWRALIDDIALDSFNASCGSVPNDLTFADAVDPGQTLTGNVCFSVPGDRVADVVLIVDDDSTFSMAGGQFFHLR